MKNERFDCNRGDNQCQKVENNHIHKHRKKSDGKHVQRDTNEPDGFGDNRNNAQNKSGQKIRKHPSLNPEPAENQTHDKQRKPVQSAVSDNPFHEDIIHCCIVKLLHCLRVLLANASEPYYYGLTL